MKAVTEKTDFFAGAGGPGAASSFARVTSGSTSSGKNSPTRIDAPSCDAKPPTEATAFGASRMRTTRGTREPRWPCPTARFTGRPNMSCSAPRKTGRSVAATNGRSRRVSSCSTWPTKISLPALSTRVMPDSFRFLSSQARSAR